MSAGTRTAIGFSVIRSLALDGSFTFDRNFRDCGFTVYPDRKGK